jgi:hypothetical protein
MAWGAERAGNIFTKYVLLGYSRWRHWSKVTEMECLQGCHAFHLFIANNVPSPPRGPWESESLFLCWITLCSLHSIRGFCGAMWFYCEPPCYSDQYSELQLNSAKLSGSKIQMQSQNGSKSQTRCSYTHFYISPLNFNAFYGPLNE